MQKRKSEDVQEAFQVYSCLAFLRSFEAQQNVIFFRVQAKELEANTAYYAKLLGHGTGKKPEEIRKDIERIKYFTAKEALEYGLVDKVMEEGALQAEKRVRLF